MGEVLKKFGRYFLLDHIAQGGMAEIYRARLASADGARRLLVIKRIQSGYGANNEFLQMFKSEINVMMGFNHPNIVQLYDFGEEQSQPYIAMEFVDGRNLRQFITRANELHQPFPIELAAYIIAQAACGLHYAHSFKDKMTGQHLNIVHRDVSPQNILISYDGNIKVIDFGIAKASINSEATRAGVIKGKPSYLSPEQISGEVLDARSDVFALGIVLWELLAGKKLFAGENDLAILKMIESCQSHVKPPSTVNPKVPKELDYIVLRILAKQREKRYQTAEELYRALHKFIYSYMPEFNPSDLSYYAKELFKDEIVEDRKKIQKLNEKVEQLLSFDLMEAPNLENSQGDLPREEETTTVAGGRLNLPDLPNPNDSFEFEKKENFGKKDPFGVLKIQEEASDKNVKPAARKLPVTQHSSSISAASASASAPPQQRVPPREDKIGHRISHKINEGFPIAWIVGAAALIGAIVFGVDFKFFGSGGYVVLEGNQKGVTVSVNGHKIQTSLPTTLKTAVGVPVHIVVTDPQGGLFEQDVTLKKGEKKSIAVVMDGRDPRTIASEKNDTPVRNGDKSVLLRLNILPGGGSPVVTINGKRVNVDHPVIRVPLDSPIEIFAERTGYRLFKRETVIESSRVLGMKEWLMDIPLEPVRFGLLTIHTTPSAEATIMMEGKPWVKKTPIEREKMPIGTYNIRLHNEVLGMEKTVTVKIEEDRVVSVDEHLEILDGSRSPASP